MTQMPKCSVKEVQHWREKRTEDELPFWMKDSQHLLRDSVGEYAKFTQDLANKGKEPFKGKVSFHCMQGKDDNTP